MERKKIKEKLTEVNGLWDTRKETTIHITGVSKQGKERGRDYLKKITAENFPSWIKKHEYKQPNSVNSN